MHPKSTRSEPIGERAVGSLTNGRTPSEGHRLPSGESRNQILEGEGEIAEADVGVDLLQPDQRVDVEPRLEPIRDPRSQEDIDQDLLPAS